MQVYYGTTLQSPCNDQPSPSIYPFEITKSISLFIFLMAQSGFYFTTEYLSINLRA